jgi:hypothetical protein
MKHVACLSLFMLFPSLALAQKQGDAPPAAAGFPLAPGFAVPPPPPPDDYPPPRYREPPPPPDSLTGLILAAGVAFGKPWGDVGKSNSGGEDLSLGTSVSGQIPLSVGAAYRPIPMFSFGVTAQYAPAMANDCGAGNSCSASDTRVGGELRLHIVPEQILSPWGAVGVGYEWLSHSADVDRTHSGWDFEIQVGGDVRMTSFLTLGPYLGLRVGTFGHVRASGGTLSGPIDQAIPDSLQATHGWWLFGVRGAFTVFASSNRQVPDGVGNSP